MYPHPNSRGGNQLSRYDSAPSSVFESSQNNNDSDPRRRSSVGGVGASNLIRQSSSPPGFLHHLTSSGFTVTKGGEGYSNSQATGGAHKKSRLSSQLSFSNQEPRLNGASSSNGFSLSRWEDGGNALVFGGHSGRRGKDELFDAQIDLSEMGVGDNMMHIPEDSVACKIRAKRGCATHPRSIAERERRTRINGKLKKLQELVPNMDKQTSYSEMLDLAIQHIAGLQFQIQKLDKELDSCSCGCKPNK